MTKKDITHGSGSSFDSNWKNRKETLYNYWASGNPKNQIQLAFRNHWLLFRDMLPVDGNKYCLEIGCGRGSMSSYFANAGYQITLVDISKKAIETARGISNLRIS